MIFHYLCKVFQELNTKVLIISTLQDYKKIAIRNETIKNPEKYHQPLK